MFVSVTSIIVIPTIITGMYQQEGSGGGRGGYLFWEATFISNTSRKINFEQTDFPLLARRQKI